MAVAVATFGLTTNAHAASLEIRPTLVTDTLKLGEQKKAYVDVINPTSEKVVVSFNVQAFKQTDDNGTLQFYDDAQVKQGIQLDLQEVELLGHEAVRMYYVVDGGKLPGGDVTAAIFATIKPLTPAPAAQAVRVGTLLVIQNGDAQRFATVTRLDAPPLQWGDELKASFAVKNMADSTTRSSFFPSVTIATSPYGKQTVDGPLIGPGREREIQYKKPGNYFGIMQIKVEVTGESKSTYIFAVTGFWRWLAPLLAVVIGAAIFIAKKYRK